MLKNLPLLTLCILALLGCSEPAEKQNESTGDQTEITPVSQTLTPTKKFRGALVGGYKGDSIFFEISEDGNRVENLAFKGHWRCSGKIESVPIAGPEGSLPIIDGKVDDHISDPPDGGATAWRFDLKAEFKGTKAEGKFRMNINALDCNSGMLSFTAEQY
jgi:hypothetical protein